MCRGGEIQKYERDDYIYFIWVLLVLQRTNKKKTSYLKSSTRYKTTREQNNQAAEQKDCRYHKFTHFMVPRYIY